FDPLKQSIFFRAARWHAGPVNETWAKVEERALATLATCVAAPTDAAMTGLPIEAPVPAAAYPAHAEQARDRVTRALLSYLVVPLFRAGGVVESCWVHREAIIPRLRQLVRGDAEVRRWIAWRVRQLTHQLRGRNFRERSPGRPAR